MDGPPQQENTGKKNGEPDEEESVLSNVDSNKNNLDLSEYCVSSDAETEEMAEDSVMRTHPKLEDLAERKRPGEENKGGPLTKKVKTQSPGKKLSENVDLPASDPALAPVPIPVPAPAPGLETEPEAEAEVEAEAPAAEGDDEGDLDEDAEEEAEESSEPKGEEIKGIHADQDIDVDAEEEVEEEVEEGNSKDREDSKPLSAMPSPIEVEQQRQTALQEITEIEHKFAELRQRLFENKMLRLKTELQMCLEGSHPRLQTYYQKIASIRDFKLRRAYQRQKYNMQCIDTETRATRTHIHQDFLRKVSDLRSKLLTETTQTWYDINKERREMDIVVPEVNYHVPVKIAGKTLSCITGYAGPAQRRYPGEPLPEDLECENITFRYRSNAVDKLEVIVDRMRLNNELSDLEGLKRFFEAFPGAPHLSGLRDSEIYEDLQQLQQLPQPPR
ncbi:related to Transcriptional regulatory protein DEP1 [Zygosaccharomyces bailii]|nr:related to Transcriptional regulatory protein DEP1 [Zygosaccharomyces bailii]